MKNNYFKKCAYFSLLKLCYYEGYMLAFLKPKISSDYIYSKTNGIMLIRPHFQREKLS